MQKTTEISKITIQSLAERADKGAALVGIAELLINSDDLSTGRLAKFQYVTLLQAIDENFMDLAEHLRELIGEDEP